MPACTSSSCSDGCKDQQAWCACVVTMVKSAPSVEALSVSGLGRAQAVGSGGFPGMHRSIAGYELLVADKSEHLEPGLAFLEASMIDNVVGIDLEWKPDTESDEEKKTKVALMQLAAGNTVLLVRLHEEEDYMPPALESFLRCPGRKTVALGWGSNDEAKMQASFGTGRATAFTSFVDLSELFQQLGYAGTVGLTGAAKHCFDLALPSMILTTMSNWEAPFFSRDQVVYAARDAIMTLLCYGKLRYWHHTNMKADAPRSGKGTCDSCKMPFGVIPPTQGRGLGASQFACLDRSCRRTYETVQAMHDHCKSTGHPGSHGLCPSCDRLIERNSLPATVRTIW